MHSDQMGLIPGIQGCFNTHKKSEHWVGSINTLVAMNTPRIQLLIHNTVLQ